MPHLVREIHSLGHEVASHGFNHELTGNCRHEELKRDIEDSKKLLEDIIGGPVCGYRAPSFSISEKMLGLIEEAGYLYDSSYNSFSANSRYGKVDFPGNGNAGIAKRISEGFYELPISNIEWAGMVLPAGGGGYFRLYPLNLFCMGVKAMLRKQNAYMFYMHPWEIDPHQPRVKDASPLSRFRHYVNLDRTMGKLREFISGLDGCGFPTCRQYLGGC
jgi:polysaccharide deacetylase family protein (PEP-CTERM system associated)